MTFLADEIQAHLRRIRDGSLQAFVHQGLACRNVRSLRPGRASGGSGGAVVWLDAVLAQQVAQAIELAVQSLVFRDDGATTRRLSAGSPAAACRQAAAFPGPAAPRRHGDPPRRMRPPFAAAPG